MKSIFSLSVISVILLTFLQACASADTDSSVETQQSSTQQVSTTDTSPGTQRSGRRGHHATVTPEVQSINTGSIQTDTNGTQTITKEVSYLSPSGTISTDFELTINTDGTIKALTATYAGRDHEDAMYHYRFNDAATNAIVGKKLSELQLDAVGGASLTTDAFNKMIETL